jgi:hypothetical protein
MQWILAGGLSIMDSGLYGQNVIDPASVVDIAAGSSPWGVIVTGK